MTTPELTLLEAVAAAREHAASTLRVVSLGAGVQSTAVLLLADAGELGRVDAAIFADTGWEPRAVYEHLERLERRVSIPIHRVSSGDVRSTDSANGKGSALDVPYYLRNSDGSDGMSRRQCTSKLKVAPIRRKLRELMLAAGARRVESLFGISVDEIQRMRTSDRKYVSNLYPLVDRRMTRADCRAYLEAAGWLAVPRSACIGCPYHSDAEWRRLKLEAPEEFAEAVAFEASVQAHGGHLRGVPFLHRSRVPLELVDFASLEDRGQLTLDDECSGVCGV